MTQYIDNIKNLEPITHLTIGGKDFKIDFTLESIDYLDKKFSQSFDVEFDKGQGTLKPKNIGNGINYLLNDLITGDYEGVSLAIKALTKSNDIKPTNKEIDLYLKDIFEKQMELGNHAEPFADLVESFFSLLLKNFRSGKQTYTFLTRIN